MNGLCTLETLNGNDHAIKTDASGATYWLKHGEKLLERKKQSRLLYQKIASLGKEFNEISQPYHI